MAAVEDGGPASSTRLPARHRIDSNRDYCVPMAVKWLDEPDAHDFDAAAAYLSMVAEADAVATVVTGLKAAVQEERAAKDILRAAQLPVLPSNNVHVRSDLSKISDGKRLSPILLVRGDAARAVPLQIADGYHRVCASYITDENTVIPCRFAVWPS